MSKFVVNVSVSLCGSCSIMRCITLALTPCKYGSSNDSAQDRHQPILYFLLSSPRYTRPDTDSRRDTLALERIPKVYQRQL